jgi:hypothetical protein
MPDANFQVTRLLNLGTTANVTGEAWTMPRGSRERVYQATIAGTGAVSATVTIQGSCDGVSWVTIGSALSLSGTGSDTKAIESLYPWPQVRAVVASITGTGATVVAYVGI